MNIHKLWQSMRLTDEERQATIERLAQEAAKAYIEQEYDFSYDPEGVGVSPNYLLKLLWDCWTGVPESQWERPLHGLYITPYKFASRIEEIVSPGSVTLEPVLGGCLMTDEESLEMYNSISDRMWEIIQE